MVTAENMLNAIDELVAIRNLHGYIRHLIVNNDDFYNPIHDKIFEYENEYEETHPFIPIFKNGVCINDDSELIVYAIIHAVNDVELEKWFTKVPESIKPTIRYTIADYLADYYEMYCWNKNTTNYAKIKREIDDQKNEVFGGKTIFL